MFNYFSTLFLLLLQTTLFAQSFNGGLLGGITASEISGDHRSGPRKSGPILGAFVNHKLDENKLLQMEIYYVQKGSRENPNANNGFTKYILRLNYIEIPILIIFKPLKKFRPEAGLAFAAHFSDTEKDINGTISSYSKFKPYDLSIIGGAAFKISEKLNIHFRYSTSLLPVRRAPGYVSKGQYNSIWFLSLHYLFKSSV